MEISTKFNSVKERVNLSERKTTKLIKYAIILAVLLVVITLGLKVFNKSDNSSIDNKKVELKPAWGSQTLNKEFSFPLKNSEGEEVSSIKYFIDNAELRDEIIVKGKQAQSVKGRTFLILNIKVKNEFTQSIEINTKDYVRLSVGGNDTEWFAPDIHNDPLEVQAISTEPTRLGFAINESDKNLTIAVGEINGEKEKIQLTLN
ncbi:MAG: hypothetical protein US53_C0016G0003 [Candidatus Woesebacteria bacterium GW2011_GWA1_37_7]|uniref:DUF4352 domain-containing protein n=2 Tax=Candidatus Woeseibacteriota TaxID=1752722 RepID=A0A0G0HG60_9BACT|nr:MAG: hypothetical protein US53_C0016G0003 [Candidatus Woesebacteria bacterium GW2011_GWA1_37_7]OGM19563.1 MAG: hypothetical protein A2685_00130 [Candidatus Woesebacteria bacterium RIFCSPHIGHO2_01_FULL_37_10]